LYRQVSSSDSVMSVKLKATLKRIAESLIMSTTSSSIETASSSSHADLSSIASTGSTGSGGVETVVVDDRVLHPHISPAVDLHRPDLLFGLTERVVATESL